MSDIWTLTCLVDDLMPKGNVINGRFFLNRDRMDVAQLEKKVLEYKSEDDAQYWMNLIPIGDYLSNLLGEWDTDGALEKGLMVKISNSIVLALSAQFPSYSFSCNTLRDGDDIVLQVVADQS